MMTLGERLANYHICLLPEKRRELINLEMDYTKGGIYYFKTPSSFRKFGLYRFYVAVKVIALCCFYKGKKVLISDPHIFFSYDVNIVSYWMSFFMSKIKMKANLDFLWWNGSDEVDYLDRVLIDKYGHLQHKDCIRILPNGKPYKFREIINTPSSTGSGNYVFWGTTIGSAEIRQIAELPLFLDACEETSLILSEQSIGIAYDYAVAISKKVFVKVDTENPDLWYKYSMIIFRNSLVIALKDKCLIYGANMLSRHGCISFPRISLKILESRHKKCVMLDARSKSFNTSVYPKTQMLKHSKFEVVDLLSEENKVKNINNLL